MSRGKRWRSNTYGRALTILALCCGALVSSLSCGHGTVDTIQLVYPTQPEWTEARLRLESLRTTCPSRAYVEQIQVKMREPRSGKVLEARGALAIDPQKSARMILLGPGGMTAVDAWVTSSAWRIDIPAISLKQRGGTDDSAASFPVAFFRSWLIGPLDGRLLFASVRGGEERYVLRHNNVTSDVHIRRAREGIHLVAHQLVDSAEARSASRVHVKGGGPGLFPRVGDTATYVSIGKARVEVDIRIESVTDDPPPDPAAFVDPDLE